MVANGTVLAQWGFHGIRRIPEIHTSHALTIPNIHIRPHCR